MMGHFDYGPEVTFEEDLAELEDVERRLGVELGLVGTPLQIRSHLARVSALGMLDETLLVADWHQLYSSHVYWLEYPEKRKHRA